VEGELPPICCMITVPKDFTPSVHSHRAYGRSKMSEWSPLCCSSLVIDDRLTRAGVRPLTLVSETPPCSDLGAVSLFTEVRQNRSRQ